MKVQCEYDVVVIGGGPGGLSSAYAAKIAGAGNVLLIERDVSLGGILSQCIHTGFGLYEYGEELTGPEYADRWIKKAVLAGVEFLTGTMVLTISSNKEVTLLGEATGISTIKAKSIILAMGCREKTRGALGIPGSRPAGIFTAGCAQRLVNIEGYMPGKKIFILGSGDIGLIMARRLTLEGATVVAVCEKSDHPGGLERNVQQCLKDFGIPLMLSSSIIDIHGTKRVEAVTVAQFSENNIPIKESIKRIECDTILLSVGLIPENELSLGAGIILDSKTQGPVVDGFKQTSIPGIFACGNVLKVYDLVDNVTSDALNVGKAAFDYINSSLNNAFEILCASPNPSNENVQNDENDIDSKISDNINLSLNYACEFLEASPNFSNENVQNDENIINETDVNENYLEIREIICTICPVGCKIKAAKKINGEWEFTGFTCKRGNQYAKDEVLNPKRTLTTSMLQVLNSNPNIKTNNDENARQKLILNAKMNDSENCKTQQKLIGIKSDKPVPLNLIMDFMNEIKKYIVEENVEIGDVVIRNVAGTDISMVVTRN